MELQKFLIVNKNHKSNEKLTSELRFLKLLIATNKTQLKRLIVISIETFFSTLTYKSKVCQGFV